MNLTLYLLTAHFLADYPLQTGWVVKLKQKGSLGLLIHTATHLLVTFLLLFPFWHVQRLWWGILIIFLTHALVDYIKMEEGKHSNIRRFVAYMVDQCTHYFIIFVVATYFIGRVAPFISSDWSVYYLLPVNYAFVILLILATYFYDISRWIYEGGAEKKAYKRDYRMIMRNGLIVTTLFFFYILYVINQGAAELSDALVLPWLVGI